MHGKVLNLVIRLVVGNICSPIEPVRDGQWFAIF